MFLKEIRIFQKQQAHYHTIDAKIAVVKMLASEREQSVLQLKRECNSFSPKIL